MKHILPALLVCTLASATAAHADEKAPVPFVCATTPEPVVSLDHGSRYDARDKSRSDFDEASNDDVNAQLKPVDSFISDLALAANRAVSSPDDRSAAADCVLSGLAVWARADALSDLATMNARLSAPSRIAGLAFAYAQVEPFLAASEDRAMVEGWLSAGATATMTYFDTEAPKNAGRNNLRAWAALAVARIGLTTGDAAMIDWADASVRLVACQAAPDGSLPLEMARKELALHYQLHAVTPLVVTAALLQGRGHDLFRACDGAIHRSVNFVLAAFDDPALVETRTGHAQSYFNGSEELRGFELAWAEAYLSVFHAPRLAQFVAGYGALGNSKIGGRQSLVWGM
ncbi:alginate lyase family protein [Paracoccaceae bacterium Fryx2]|nr:alginate lyase family protein [Paracoccaceae bacterium Fryx2]